VVRRTQLIKQYIYGYDPRAAAPRANRNRQQLTANIVNELINRAEEKTCLPSYDLKWHLVNDGPSELLEHAPIGLHSDYHTGIEQS